MQQKFSTSRTVLNCALVLCFAGYQSLIYAQDPTPETPPAAEATATTADAKAPVKDAPKPDASALKPFKDVIKGAKQSKGFFTLFQKDEKV
ncbi:MAG TPA: hypothetical protein VK832_03515, partial [Burkholderiaceae bacterium]|nr:hypothetical protein [Burkholderiaceae bacterium]